jgi:hypothetical protein
MKAQVLTTTRSASAAERAGVSPSPIKEATTLSESTAFLGQPRVSTQKRSWWRGRLKSGDPMTGLEYPSL